MTNFFKGIIIGIGGIAPGLSGSILLVIFGLYQKTITAIGTFFKNVKQNFLFLFPLVLGFGVGILLFSKLIDFLLNNYEMYTRFSFLGLILGTIPLFFKEVKKEGYDKKYNFLIIAFFIIGFTLFTSNESVFTSEKDSTIFQSILLGIAVAGSSIVPGIDSAVILSSLGLYELYVGSLASMNFSVLIPASFGLIFGALIISFIITKLLRRYYTLVFSIIFGLFLGIVPNVLNSSCILALNYDSIISVFLSIVCFFISYSLGNLDSYITKFKQSTKYIKKISNNINYQTIHK